MRGLAVFVFSACLIAWAGDCPPDSPISLYSDWKLDLEIFFDQSPAASTFLQVYSDDKVVHSLITNHDGRVALGPLPVGNYRVVIPRKGTLDIVVLPQKIGLYVEMISWYLFPKSKYKWVEGTKVAGKPCPMVVIKAD